MLSRTVLSHTHHYSLRRIFFPQTTLFSFKHTLHHSPLFSQTHTASLTIILSNTPCITHYCPLKHTDHCSLKRTHYLTHTHTLSHTLYHTPFITYHCSLKRSLFSQTHNCITGLGHVEDLAVAMANVIGKEVAKGKIYNIQDVNSATFEGLAKLCATGR